jgi:peptidoglycan/xylan/chitin deacetylase (PgdA/CDA1 family)
MDTPPIIQTVAVDNREQIKDLGVDAISTTLIPTLDNKEQVEKLKIDTTPTSQLVAIDNPELVGELSIGTIPSTNPAALDDEELMIESMGTIPTTLIPVVTNPRLSGELSTNAIPITPISAVSDPELVIEPSMDIFPTTQTPTVSNPDLVIEPSMDNPTPMVSNPDLVELSANIISTIEPVAVDSKERAIAVGIDKIPTIKLPIIAKKSKRKGSPALIIGITTVLLFSVIVSIYLLVSANISSHKVSQRTKARSQQATPIATIIPAITTSAVTTPTVTPTDDADEVTALGQQYMNALLNQQYDTMWSLLHPQVQAMWPNEISFSNYWQTRFQGFTLQQFTLGQVHSLSFWVNPETMVRYDQVEVLPISLQLSPQVSADKVALLPTLDQNPSQLFQNLPLIAQRTTIRTGRESTDQWQILCGGPADLEAPILPPITPVSRTITMPILMYHHITDVPTHDVLDFSLTVTPSIFGQQLDYLKQHGYHTITFNQLFDFLYYNGPLPSKPIILTFDDGYDDAYKFAYPILQAHGYSGMFYIITGKVGWKGQATWDQLREMLANGMQIGSHTITHRNIGAVWRFSHVEAQQELQQSKQSLQTQLGILIQQFCYPSGEPFHTEKPYVQQAIMALLEQDGYIGATTDPPPVGMTQDSQKPFILLRVRVDGRESLQSFFKSIP